MPGFRRLLERLDEFVVGVPNHDVTPEHFDSLDPDAQHNLTDHVANNPNPIFVEDDSVTGEQPAVVVDQPEPQPVPATNEPQQVVPQTETAE
jgi:hypothetical protein